MTTVAEDREPKREIIHLFATLEGYSAIIARN
jgi:hypothetical protein